MIQTGMLDDVEAIIFDMDGTLLDSMWIWPSVDDDYLCKYHLDKPDNFHEMMEGKSYVEVARLFLDIFPGLDQTLEEVMDEWMEMTYDRYIHSVDMKEGAHEFILDMRAQGMKIGIATSNSNVLADAALNALSIRPLFDSVHSACEVEKGKPSPDVYLLVAEEMHVPPQRCLVFEDVPMGILAGKRAGMKVCGVDDDYSRPQEARKKELADYYIQSYYDISKGTYEVLT